MTRRTFETEGGTPIELTPEMAIMWQTSPRATAENPLAVVTVAGGMAYVLRVRCFPDFHHWAIHPTSGAKP